MFKKLKNKKGFTLVELIVVLVILAILAALLVPALTGYIDKANNEKIIATTRQVVVAAQTEASEAYGKNKDGVLASADVTVKTGVADPDKCPVHIADIVKLAEVGSVDDKNAFTGTNGVTYVEVTMAKEDGKVKTVIVKQSGKQCTYSATPATGKDTYEVEKAGNKEKAGNN